MQLILADSWQELMAQETSKSYWSSLVKFIKAQYLCGSCFPPQDQIFRAFELTPLDQVKVVILGQDPYHGFGQAHGLAFSVPEGIPKPPSLLNILKEVYKKELDPSAAINSNRSQGRNDLIDFTHHSGDLSHWAMQGVLLLNTVLTVESGKAGSHQKKGWELFTDAVIEEISLRKTGVVFMLWGRFAKGKEKLIDSSRHCVLHCGHPSPLSANRGLWFGNDHFNKANEYIEENGGSRVIWQMKEPH